MFVTVWIWLGRGLVWSALVVLFKPASGVLINGCIGPRGCANLLCYCHVEVAVLSVKYCSGKGVSVVMQRGLRSRRSLAEEDSKMGRRQEHDVCWACVIYRRSEVCRGEVLFLIRPAL
jgi:hypothetical protein